MDLWAKAHMGQGPYGPGPIWGPGPGPSLFGRTDFKKMHPKQTGPIMYLLCFYEHQKDTQRNSEQFGGSIAPRSLF